MKNDFERVYQLIFLKKSYYIFILLLVLYFSISNMIVSTLNYFLPKGNVHILYYIIIITLFHTILLAIINLKVNTDAS